MLTVRLRAQKQIPPVAIKIQEGKQPENKVLGQDIPGTSGTQTSGYRGQKVYACFFLKIVSVVLDREWPGCFGISDMEKLHVKKHLG